MSRYATKSDFATVGTTSFISYTEQSGKEELLYHQVEYHTLMF